MRYFQQFPLTDYNDRVVTNIAKRVKVLEAARSAKTIYYEYLIKDGETPDAIAYNYYGDAYDCWVIFLVNNIVDINFDWPMSQKAFDNHMKIKYGSFVAARSTILFYEKNQEQYYVGKTSVSSIITSATYAALSASQQQSYEAADLQEEPERISVETYDTMTSGQDEYSPVYAYDYELERNEDKRKIKLLDLSFLSTAQNDLTRLMKE